MAAPLSGRTSKICLSVAYTSMILKKRQWNVQWPEISLIDGQERYLLKSFLGSVWTESVLCLCCGKYRNFPKGLSLGGRQLMLNATVPWVNFHSTLPGVDKTWATLWATKTKLIAGLTLRQRQVFFSGRVTISYNQYSQQFILRRVVACTQKFPMGYFA